MVSFLTRTFIIPLSIPKTNLWEGGKEGGRKGARTGGIGERRVRRRRELFIV